ncbi:MAG TPA: hypothetical protein VH591_17760 [Ktedonobacterales bacterium]|jgi:hypothetical protein
MTMQHLTDNDLALLRRFEPVLCFNRGEQFYPMSADLYLTQASLWRHRPDADPELLVPPGKLDDTTLTVRRDEIPGAVYYLRVAHAASLAEVRAFRHTSTLREFHTGPGRLVRVGLLARFLDLFFSLSLLLRGNTPGGLAVGAAQRYQVVEQSSGNHRGTWYHGRVVRQHGYIALQYYFFYAFNDWRSSFHGVNDHEGDWEMVTVYAAEDKYGRIQPCWMACSAHLGEGDDLRRRWDDPGLERLDEHPIVYVGAGSHANYFFRGEYMPAVEIPFTQPLARAWREVRRLWARLGQGDSLGPPKTQEGIHIPFVDYARGDGLRVGPGQPQTWQVCLLQPTAKSPAPPWVDDYRGLWGLRSGDLLGGEDAPTGPRFDRSGGERKRWYDPIGWSGLDKTPPPADAMATLDQQQRRLREQRDELSHTIDDVTAQLMGLEMEVAAQRATFSRDEAAKAQQQLEKMEKELTQLKAERADIDVAEEQCAAYAERLAAGDPGDPRAHLHAPDLPVSAADLRLGRLAAIWSAVSVGVLLLSIVVLAQFFPGILIPGAAVLLGVYAFIEALFHRTLDGLIRGVAVALALVATVVLVIQFALPLLLALVVLVGIFILVENVRELIT